MGGDFGQWHFERCRQGVLGSRFGRRVESMSEWRVLRAFVPCLRLSPTHL